MHTLNVTYDNVQDGTTVADILFISDVHYDSVECDREMLARHIKWAQDNNAFVFVNGDWFDFMQGRYDPRSNKDAMRPEYMGGDYIDKVIEDSAEYIASWGLPVFFAQGNHETNIRKRQETDVLNRLIALLRVKGVDCWLGGYSGWFAVNATYKDTGKRTRQYVVHYHHGKGGNAPRSKGVLHVDIDRMQFPDSQLTIRGHNHQKWAVPIVVKRLTNKMNVIERLCHHVQLGSYKKFGDGYAGWGVEKGFNEPTLGGYKVRLHLQRHSRIAEHIRAEITEAN